MVWNLLDDLLLKLKDLNMPGQCCFFSSKLSDGDHAVQRFPLPFFAESSASQRQISQAEKNHDIKKLHIFHFLT